MRRWAGMIVRIAICALTSAFLAIYAIQIKLDGQPVKVSAGRYSSDYYIVSADRAAARSAIFSLLLFAVAVFFILDFRKQLRQDRRAKRRAASRCEYCGHSMQGLTTIVCPECGKKSPY